MRVLVTGDDGCRASGTYLLANCLKNIGYETIIVGTDRQQSGMGGALGLTREKIAWRAICIDGIEAYSVDGTPVDAVEFARSYFPDPFDIIISGMNFGLNLGGALISSGTFSALFRGLNIGLADQGLAINWDCPLRDWFENDYSSKKWQDLIIYPGKIIEQIIILSQANNLWGSDILNINFPNQPSSKVVFTKSATCIRECYDYTLPIDKKFFHFALGPVSVHQNKKGTDVRAIQDGHISITPCQSSFVDHSILQKMQDCVIKL